jgi:glycosyltransferase involved in cell wall biosynthesis
MRVLQAIAGAPHGGAEAFFERLALALAHAGETQKLVIRREDGRAARLRGAGLDFAELGFGRALDFWTKPRLGRIIADFKPQVVVTWMSRATSMCPRGDFVHAARLGGYYDLHYYRHCHHLIGNTRALVGWMIDEGWPQERVHYLPNFAERIAMPPVARASLETPSDAPLALALGRLHVNKAFDTLLEAVARVKPLHLWLAGEGPLDHALKRQAAALGIESRVHFLGWRDDVPALLAAANMVICASRLEPLGNTILEAWAAKKPVVAAAARGPAELIETETTGLLVPIDDAAAMAQAIERLMDDRVLAASLAAAGHERYAAEFSEASVVARYRDFFKQVTR